MKKLLLVAVNAKFIHTNLAIRSIKKYCDNNAYANIITKEFTINQQIELIMHEILRQMPDIIGFSCYIWNYEIIKNLSRELKKLLPNTFIFFGGPEVSFNPQEVLTQTNGDCVICGEGENGLTQLLDIFANNLPKKSVIYGKPIPLEQVDFLYTQQDFVECKEKIIYYEASRGCPFNCQYCLSGSDARVRTLPLSRVFADLRVFLNAKVRQVKFVDRTFNFDKKYAMEIWKFLAENDNKITNFHFEIAAELMTDDMIFFLNSVRKGLFQLEIGVQSTNPQTLEAVNRITNPQKLIHVIALLQNGKNINLHLDLIAGLPFEGFDSFAESFNFVYSLAPQQLQLGFLKLLKGSGLFDKAQDYGLVFTEYAPYEVTKTTWLSFADVLNLKMTENMVEIYYNSGRYRKSIEYLLTFFKTPFSFFYELAKFYESKNYHLSSQGKVMNYTILWEFFAVIENANKDDNFFKTTLFYDMYSHEKVTKLPEFLADMARLNDKKRREINEFITNEENLATYNLLTKTGLDENNLKSQFNAAAHIETMLFNPLTNEKEQTCVLFCYNQRDLWGNATTHILKI